MRFGRVVGTILEIPTPGTSTDQHGWLQLAVTLEDGSAVSVIRSGTVPSLIGPDGPMELSWQADQYTQETIGNELAVAGWEPIGTTDESGDITTGALAASSPTYIVRLM